MLRVFSFTENTSGWTEKNICLTGKKSFSIAERDFGQLQVSEVQAMSDMSKYECGVCGYIYDPALGDPDNGVAPGTPFKKLPDEWRCPLCGADKSVFVKVENT